ncbi:hypothetical protein [Halobacillus sp. B23F22_1]|uniref:hypothetical protein n=1 Tax=Halobacillus sp. B23F22_1 TaxID=3459514 RepID=UPI00373E5955
MNRAFLTILCLLLLGACSNSEERPKNVSKEVYGDLQEVFERYLDQKNDPKTDWETGMDLSWEHRKAKKKGDITSEEWELSQAVSNIILTYNGTYQEMEESLFDYMSAEIFYDDIRSLNTEEKEMANLLNVDIPDNPEQKEKLKKAYEDSQVYAGTIMGRNDLEFEDFSNAFVVERTNGDFYVASYAYYQDKEFKYEMHLGEDQVMKNAYIPGAYGGMFTTEPMTTTSRAKLENLGEKFASVEEIEKRRNQEEDEREADEIRRDIESAEILEDVYGSAQVPSDEAIIEEDNTPNEATSGEPIEKSNEEGDWDGKQYLTSAYDALGELISEIQNLNDEMVAMSVNEEEAYAILDAVIIEKDNLKMMIADPETNQHINDADNESMSEFIIAVEELIEMELSLLKEAGMAETAKIQKANDQAATAEELLDGLRP